MEFSGCRRLPLRPPSETYRFRRKLHSESASAMRGEYCPAPVERDFGWARAVWICLCDKRTRRKQRETTSKTRSGSEVGREKRKSAGILKPIPAPDRSLDIHSPGSERPIPKPTVTSYKD